MNESSNVLGVLHILCWPCVVLHDPELDSAGLIQAWPEIGGWLLSLKDWGSGSLEEIQVLAHELVHVAEQAFQIPLTETQVDAISAVLVAGLAGLGVVERPSTLEDLLEICEN